MNVSLFPKGRYIAKKTLLFYKTPHSNNDINMNRPFALIFETLNGAQTVWDITSFRPDPYFDKEFTESASNTGMPSIVLYEKINCSSKDHTKCFKVPRYIYLPPIDSDGEGKWFVNIR